jgi:predicted nucleotidyltransferase
MAKHHLDMLPRSAKRPLDELAKSLRESLGDALVSIIVYGSAARGEYKEGSSDLDVLVVVSDTTRDALVGISNALVLARSAAGIETMLLTEEEILRAADVFPLFYEDIQKCHAVVFGRDPFDGLVISASHRRLRIEQELRDAQIRLRRAVIDGRGDERALGRVVARKLRQLRFPLRALLELSGVECQSHALDVVLQKACKRFGVDGGQLLRVSQKPEAAFDALTALLSGAIAVVDHLEDG